jgi:hypothetical protein
MKFAQLLIVVILSVASARPCHAQFIRPPVIIPRVPVHIPVHVPHVPGAHHGKGDSTWDDVLGWGLIGGAGVAVGGGSWYAVRKWRQRQSRRAVIRITSPPPGEVPEFARRAWVGLELPLIAGQVLPENVAAQEALSRQAVYVATGYAVDGQTAIAILESANPEAAAWWRQHAPDVLAPGYQLVFPAEVCERLDDLGT